ncbi:uncharacterized protein [Diabrotica undecimpunctata]|uniref:uncharacterized protein n=1 Tax=Diabrotica undecimpunctata TaxID=50387 RepID=UPI003B635D20
MKSVLVVLLGLISLTIVAGQSSSTTSVVSTAATTSINEDEVYVEHKNVPDPVYEIDAVEAFRKAKELFPIDSEDLLETFSKLFNTKHKVSGGWKVAEKCGYVYNPNANYMYIELRVIDNNGDRNVLIFN